MRLKRHRYEIVDLADATAPGGVCGASGADVVPLERAQLCLDCESITAAEHGQCECCGSRSLLGLARVLNREETYGEEA